MRSKPGTNDKANNGPAPKPAFEAKILRLVRGAKERRAVQRGEVDAIIDPASGLIHGRRMRLASWRRQRCRKSLHRSSHALWEKTK